MEYSINVDDPDPPAKIGTYDIVYCARILYHTPSTLYTLERLRSVTSGYLLIGTMIVPDKVENELGMVDFRGGRLLFMPGLDEPSRSVMARHFTDNGLEIMDINTKESWPWR